jgi:hypothetical protein
LEGNEGVGDDVDEDDVGDDECDNMIMMYL